MIIKMVEVDKIAGFLKASKIGVLPTDTIYGLHGLADNTGCFDRIYELKKRPPDMPFISLISSLSDLDRYHIVLSHKEQEMIKQFWPGPNTLIFLDDQKNTRSFRLPRNDFLQAVIKLTGPLISTSANLHGQSAAKDLLQCQETFGQEVDFYVDGGVLDNPPSSIYKTENGEVIKLR